MARTDDRPLWTLVARREIGVRLRSKLFLISTALLLLVVVGAMIALHVLSNRSSTSRLAVAPAAAQVLAGQSDLALVDVASDDAARAEVRAGSADAALVQATDGTSGWTLVFDSASDSSSASALSAQVQQAVAAAAIAHNAATLGVPVSAVLAGSAVDVQLLTATSDTAAYQWGLTFAFGLLFFLSCQLFGSTIASSVAEEKESRVVEVLLAAIPVRALLVGKIVGNAALGVAQMALVAVAALATAELIGGVPHLGAIIASSGWFLLFYLVGFGAVSCLFAGFGALASRTQDLQAATMPVQLLVVATYMCAVIGKGTIVTVTSYVPVLSTVTMPARIFTGTVVWWQVGASLLAAVVFAVLSVALAVRIYTASILQSGARVSLLTTLRADRTPAVTS